MPSQDNDVGFPSMNPKQMETSEIVESSERTTEDKVPHHIQFDFQEEEDIRESRILEHMSSWKQFQTEMINYHWKDKVPILTGILLIPVVIVIVVVTTL